MGAAFFLAAVYLAWGGWYTVFKRVVEAISQWMPFAAGILFIVLILGNSHLYEWTHKEVVEHDELLQHKSVYLNLPFFFIRFIFFVSALIICTILLRRASLKEDTLPHGDTSMHKRSLVLASVFVPFFAVYILVTAWDWLMSLDPHWYSTMYGWYSFASFWVTSISVITLFTIFLKKAGYLKEVNVNHFHNLGIMMFAFSIFWTYVTFCQFMLIWYANIPEETIYFQHRYGHYHFLFYGIFIMNFVLPFLLLMSRDAKRNLNRLAFVACIIIFGHFVDFYLMIMPASLGPESSPPFGFLEIGLPCLYAGLLLYVVFTSLTKAKMVPSNHPYLQESLHNTL